MREGADIEYRDEAGCTPLHHAVFGGSVDTVRWILQAGADVNAVNDWFGTPLCLAAIRGNLAVTELLIEHNADLNQECSNLGSAAHAACASGDIAIVQAVHSGGARWNVRRKTCAEALSHLIQLPQDEGLLLPYHKLLETRVRQRQSPRAIAIKFRHSGVVDFYSGLGKGLSVNEIYPRQRRLSEGGQQQPTTLRKMDTRERQVDHSGVRRTQSLGRKCKI
jgi:ankyrin repeat protein